MYRRFQNCPLTSKCISNSVVQYPRGTGCVQVAGRWSLSYDKPRVLRRMILDRFHGRNGGERIEDGEYYSVMTIEKSRRTKHDVVTQYENASSVAGSIV